MDPFNVHRHEFIEPFLVHIEDGVSELDKLYERILFQQKFEKLDRFYRTSEAAVFLFVRVDVTEQ